MRPSLGRVRTGGVSKELVLAGVLVGVLAVTVVWGALGSARGSSSGSDPGAGPGGPPAPDAASVERGKQAYMTTCIACHGEHGEARPNLGKDLAHSTFLAGLSDDEAVAFLKRGRDPGDPLNTTGVAMPPKGGNPALGDAQLHDIVAFVRSLQPASR